MADVPRFGITERVVRRRSSKEGDTSIPDDNIRGANEERARMVANNENDELDNGEPITNTTSPEGLTWDWTRPLILCVGLLVIIEGVLHRSAIDAALQRLVDWVADHPTLGILAVVLVYILATICFVPGSVLTIGTGYAFGKAFNESSTLLAVALSSLAVFVGASLGSLCCFVIGRYLFRAPVIRLAQQYPLIQAIDRGE